MVVLGVSISRYFFLEEYILRFTGRVYSFGVGSEKLGFKFRAGIAKERFVYCVFFRVEVRGWYIRLGGVYLGSGWLEDRFMRLVVGF